MPIPRIFIIAVIAMLAIGAGLWWQFSGDSAPTMTQQTGGPMVAVTLPESLTAVAQDGKILFERSCAACHGENAAGSDKGPPLVHRIYEPNHHGDQAFLLAARNGVRSHHWQFGNMPPRPEVREPEVAAIVAYVRELQKANGIF